jgi:hypothetical protein
MKLHVNTSGTSGLTGVANRGMIITDSVGARLVLEDTGATSNRKNFMLRSESDAFTISGLNDDGTSFTTENMFVISGSSGNVGIGTGSPVAPLVVSNGGAAGMEFHPELVTDTNRLTNYDRTASAYMNYRQDALTHQFYVSGSEKMRIDSNGDAYFGTTTDLGGQVNIASNGLSERQLVIADSDNTTGRLFISHNGSTSTIASQGTSTVGTVIIGGQTTGASPTYCTFTNTGVTIAGALSKGSGSFKIDHPLKPETHHLVHSFIEGPQADNLYRGVIQLENGRAVIDLDDWFGMTAGTFLALNRDIQAFVNNSETWDAVRAHVQGSQLVIECQNADSNATVSWLVIGERQDKEIYESILTDDNGKIIVEPQKVTEE